AHGPYKVPHVWNRTRAIFTNEPPSGAFRGFGIPQAAIASEEDRRIVREDLATIGAPEGTEGNVSDSGIGTFRVLLQPNIVIVKSAQTLSDPYNLGVNPKNIFMTDSKGILHTDRKELQVSFKATSELPCFACPPNRIIRWFTMS
ncbi:MAG: molybdopterin-dependent oxidoreductase, partial [Oscillochloris sp.]|nr:molybdopterin-dependent oxidoreductase [Oscillochloris sp.]